MWKDINLGEIEPLLLLVGVGRDDVVEISSRKKSELFPDVKGERVRVTWLFGVTGSI